MTNKLVNDFEKKKQFFLSNENFFLQTVSIRFPFNQKQLTKYKNILCWNNVVLNEKIKWNTDIIDEFKEQIFTTNTSLADFHFNDALPWGIEFIERYEGLWDWYLLAQNSSVMDNLEIRNHFYKNLYPYIEEFGESCDDSSKSFGERCLDVFDNDIEHLEKHKELQFQHPNEIIVAESIDWFRLSQNTLLPWSAELIGTHIDKWDWSCLGINESVPWDFKLIKTFEHKIDWTLDIFNADDSITHSMTSISGNMSIEWDSLLIKTFLHKLNKFDISISESAKWDIDLLIQFQEFWDYDTLAFNRIVWNKVFSEFNAEEHIIPLLDLKLKKQAI